VIMWTIVSDEVLWHQEEPPKQQMELRLGNKVVILDVDPAGSARVSRLISSDPADYMDARWQPGAPFPARGTI